MVNRPTPEETPEEETPEEETPEEETPAEVTSQEAVENRNESRGERGYRNDAPSQQRVQQAVQPEPVPGDEDGGGDEVTDKMNEALEKGYVGIRIDETPLEDYSVEGVARNA